VYGQSSFPSRPVKLLVPYAARGLPDIVARTVGKKMEEMFGQPVIVENRPGASGGVAANALAKSAADGYTLLLTEGSIFYNEVLFTKLPYSVQDLLPVALLARAPQFLVVNQNVPVSSMRAFIDYVKARPGKLNYGSAGLGSPHHIAMEALKAGLQLNLVHVAYKGSGEAVPALVGGHIDAMFSAYPSIVGYVKEKRLTLLATNDSRPISRRLSAYSDPRSCRAKSSKRSPIPELPRPRTARLLSSCSMPALKQAGLVRRSLLVHLLASENE
jgi:tripartite-type tricarboxylate transporter receptor subunit TctC